MAGWGGQGGARGARHDEAAGCAVLLHGSSERVLGLLAEAIHLVQHEDCRGADGTRREIGSTSHSFAAPPRLSSIAFDSGCAKQRAAGWRTPRRRRRRVGAVRADALLNPFCPSAPTGLAFAISLMTSCDALGCAERGVRGQWTGDAGAESVESGVGQECALGASGGHR